MLYQTHASTRVLRMLRGDTEPAAAPHTSAEVFERSAKAGLRIHEVDQAIAAAAARKRCGSWQSGAADNYRDWLALSTVEMRHKR